MKDHAVKVLQAFDESSKQAAHFGLPLDAHIRDYTRQYRSRRPASLVGARDRKELKDKVYEIVRHKAMLQRLSRSDSDYSAMYDLLGSTEFVNQRQNQSLEE